MPFDSGCKAAPQSADTHCQIGVCFHKTSVKTHPRGNGKVGDSNALSRRAEALVKLNCRSFLCSIAAYGAFHFISVSLSAPVSARSLRRRSSTSL